MKKILVLFFLIACQQISVFSQALTKKEKISYMFSLMELDSMMEKTLKSAFSNIGNGMTTQIEESDITKIRKLTEDKAKVMINDFLKKDMVTVYDKYFEEKEIDDFIAFHKSDSGKKMLKQQASIMSEIMQIMQSKYMKEFQNSITEEMMKVLEKK
jgi:uncharacterized protein